MIELMLQAERALSMGLVDSAEHLYWQAVESDGRNVIAIVGLAKVALARGDDRTALQFARKALELDPEDGAASRLVERLEDLARLRTGSPPQVTAAADRPEPAAETGPNEGDPAVVADSSPAAGPVAGGEADAKTTIDPVTKPSRADIEWPSTDVLGAAPSALPRVFPARSVPAASAAPGSVPREPEWPAVLPPASPRAEPEAAESKPIPPAASPTTPPPTKPTAAAPPEPDQKRGLMGRFRRNG